MGRGREKSLLIPNNQQLGWIQLGSGAMGAACCPRKCSWGGIPQDAAALHHQAVCCRERRGGLLELWMRRAIHLLHCSAGLSLFPQFSQHPGFLLGLHATPALLPAVAWIQPGCISQSPCFRHHLFLGCPTCSKDKEPRPFQRSQHAKQGLKKKYNQNKPLSLWKHHIHLSVPHRQTNTGIACPGSGGEQGTRASLSWDSP